MYRRIPVDARNKLFKFLTLCEKDVMQISRKFKPICSNTSSNFSDLDVRVRKHHLEYYFRIPFSTFARTVPIMENLVVKVPSMGDSITEGTIVEWTVEMGQAVKEGDVVALVETDKVTVDIKADVDGVITAKFGNVDDTIEVGSDLYQIDTEAAEFAAPVSEEVAESSTPPTSELKPILNNVTPSKTARIPSIHFLGSEGWKKKRTVVDNSALSVQNTGNVASEYLSHLDPMYGRPAFTEDEMEALISGGANLAPDLESFSRGA